ncbi:MAG: class II aldolase/adducin family protein, partial [Burkholderiales bacterium]
AFGHVSARVPGTDTFVLPTRRSPGLAQADNLLLLNTEGKLLAGDGQPNSEFWIHARIYAARPDVGGVVHAHPPGCICLTQIGQPLKVVFNAAASFRDGVPEYSRIGLIRSRELGDLVAKSLGSSNAVMMRGHGMAVALPDVRSAAVVACYLEETASLQLRMLSAAGGDSARLRVYNNEEAAQVGGDNNASTVTRAWEYYSAAIETLPLGHVTPG